MGAQFLIYSIFVSINEETNQEEFLYISDLEVDYPNLYEIENSELVLITVLKEKLGCQTDEELNEHFEGNVVELINTSYINQKSANILINELGAVSFFTTYVTEVDKASSQDEYHAFLTYKAQQALEVSYRDINDISLFRNTKDFVKSQLEGRLEDFLVIDWDQSANNLEDSIEGTVTKDGQFNREVPYQEDFYVIFTY